MHDHDEQDEDVVLLECDHARCTVTGGEDDFIYISSGRWSDVTEGLFCVEHTETCDCCGEIRHRDDLAQSASRGWGRGDDVCPDCMDEYTYCDGCGELYPNDCIHWYDTTGCGFCESCDEEQGREGRPVTTCRECGTNREHLDLLTERMVCDCEAEKIGVALVMRREKILEIMNG